MGSFSEARAAYLALRDDGTAVAQIRAEHKALHIQKATSDNFGFDLTSATVNGQNFSGSHNVTKRQRLLMLDQLVAMFDHDAAISSQTTPIFDGHS